MRSGNLEVTYEVMVPPTMSTVATQDKLSGISSAKLKTMTSAAMQAAATMAPVLKNVSVSEVTVESAPQLKDDSLSEVPGNLESSNQGLKASFFLVLVIGFFSTALSI